MRPELLEPAGGLMPRTVIDAISLVSAPVRRQAVENWTEMELAVAYDWAMRLHLHASDNRVRTRTKPSFVTAAETYAIPDREHIVELDGQDHQALREWLKAPNGALLARRVTFATNGGSGLLIRTYPFRAASAETDEDLYQRATLEGWQITLGQEYGDPAILCGELKPHEPGAVAKFACGEPLGLGYPESPHALIEAIRRHAQTTKHGEQHEG